MKKIRENRIDNIFELVSKVEKRIGVYDNSSQSSYGLVGNWIIQRKYLNALVFSTMRGNSSVKIPSFSIDASRDGVLRFIKAYFMSPRLQYETSAQSILVKNNIRAFYINVPVPFTVKIMVGTTRSKGDMVNEIAVREKVVKSKTVHVPEIIHYELENAPPFFSEEIISGRVVNPRKDKELILTDLTNQLWGMYEKFGIIFKEIEKAIDTKNIENILLKAMDVIEWNENWPDKDTFIERTIAITIAITKGKYLMPYSIGHGDLSTENMILSRSGKIYISDWELSREMPVIFDLYGIMTKVSESRKIFKEKIDDLILNNDGKDIIPFYNQCYLSVLAMILRWEDSLNYTRKINRKESTFLRKLSNQFKLANEILLHIEI